MKKSILALIILLGLGILCITISLGTFFFLQFSKKSAPSSFDECVAQGNPVMDSYPEQCRSKEGKLFTNHADGEEITVTGEFECLPHNNQDGPQTLECAFGIKNAAGEHFGIDDPEMKYITTVATGKKVTVKGTLKKGNSSQYPIIGTITISSLTLD